MNRKHADAHRILTCQTDIQGGCLDPFTDSAAQNEKSVSLA